jgi:hypothetical protein
MPKAGQEGPPSLRVISGGQSRERKRDARKAQAPRGGAADGTAKGKRVQFDLETWHALNLLARDRMMSFQELADEAFRDLLRKHGRPADLKEALRRSVGDAGPRHPQRRKQSAREPTRK